MANAPLPNDGTAVEGTTITARASASFSSVLEQIGSSLLVSTYQAGHVVVVQSKDGQLRTDFHQLQKPMGIARHKGRLAIGSKRTVTRYHNVPTLTAKLGSPSNACFAPYQERITGDIDVHEMAFDGDGELWLVNTRFGCLCTLDDTSSFRPRWKPHFITELRAEDRCHLNGLAMVDGRPPMSLPSAKPTPKEGGETTKLAADC